jgi:hypothetical protein
MNQINPFANYGRQVSPERFWGRRSIIRFFFDRLNSDAPISVTGERRIGKTSFLHYLKSPYAHEQYDVDPSRYIFVYVDLLNLNNPSPIDFWRRLLNEMSSMAAGKPWATHLNMLIQDLNNNNNDGSFDYSVEEFFNRVNTYGSRPVFLLDEFEKVSRSEKLSEEFFNGLRVHTSDRITLIIASRESLKDTCQLDYKSSPFFNVFASRNLVPFTEEEFQGWFDNRLQGIDIAFTEELREFVVDISGKHPFFSEMTSCYLYDILRDNKTVDIKNQKDVRQQVYEEARPHFDYYWEKSSDEEKITLSLMALHGRQKRLLHRGDSQSLDNLARRSLVLRDQDEYFYIFSSLFEEYVKMMVYAQSNPLSPTYDDFIDNFSSRQPKEVVRNLANTAKSLFLKINPRYWQILLEFLLNHGNPQVLLNRLAAELSS